LGWGWLSTLTTPIRARSLLSPMTDVGLAAAKVAHHLGLASVGGGWVVSLAQVTGLALAALICGVALTGRARWGSITGLGVSLLAVVVLAPIFQPWYLLWGMVPMAAAGPGRLRPLLVWSSAGLSVLVLPNGGAATDVVTLGFLCSVVAVAALSVRDGRRGDRLSPA
jgi:alpha-1,6-mannosyltransferase